MYPKTHSLTFDVTGLGSLAIDFIGSIEKWPEKGTKNPFTAFNIYDGGLTGTALTAVARLGGKAAFIGKLGFSEFADRAVQSLKKEGVDLSNLIRDKNSEPIIAMILSDASEGNRNIFFKKENLNFPFPDEIPDPYWFKKTRVFFTDHVAGKAGVESAAIAHENGLDVVIDVERLQDNVTELLGYANHVIVSSGFAKLFSGSFSVEDQFTALLEKTKGTVIITQGERGSFMEWKGQRYEIPAFRAEVKDTTGCGDVFHGVYALGIARGHEPYDAAIKASAAAAMSSMHTGGREGIPDAAGLESFLSRESH